LEDHQRKMMDLHNMTSCVHKKMIELQEQTIELQKQMTGLQRAMNMCSDVNLHLKRLSDAFSQCQFTTLVPSPWTGQWALSWPPKGFDDVTFAQCLYSAVQGYPRLALIWCWMHKSLPVHRSSILLWP
jgi:hypothetical protein